LGFLLALVCASMLWLFNYTLDEVGDRAQDEMLRRQAVELLSYMKVGKEQEATFVLPRDVASMYANRDEGYVFVLHDGHGNIIARSHPLAVALLREGLIPVSESTFLDTSRVDGETAALYMLVRPVPTPRGMRYLTVGQSRTIDDVLLVAASRDATKHLLLWLVPAFLVVLMTVGTTVSAGLLPLRRLSTEVRAIGAKNPDQRLQLVQVPNEVKPLVESVNALLEQLGRALTTQRQLSADTAHQLKTPLAIMQARLELLDNLPGRDDLIADIHRMNRLVTQMLHYAQLMQSEAAFDPMNLGDAARDVVGRLAPLAHGQKVGLEVTAPAKPVKVLAAPLLATEAIQNLVDNAIRHSPAGRSVEVEVTTDGKLLVHDRGKGVPATERDLVFSRFWQGEQAEQKRGSRAQPGGSGLGLAIVAEIMRQHGGAVWVADRSGGGSTFGLTFRLANQA
jgi:signal transduction histidine kinase